jgi:enamine deaminase RidA (YjgF/YER057c/UK114 family)
VFRVKEALLSVQAGDSRQERSGARSGFQGACIRSNLFQRGAPSGLNAGASHPQVTKLPEQRVVTLQLLLSPAAVSRGTGRELGGARLGGGAPAVDWPEQAISAPLLGSTADSLRETWLADGPASAGVSEGIAWRRAGDLLYGVVELAEAGFAGAGIPPLQAASRAASDRIFRLLDAQGLPCLWRVWNYLADTTARRTAWNATASSTSAARTPSSTTGAAPPATCRRPAPSAWPADRCRSPSWPVRSRRCRSRTRARSAPTTTRPNTARAARPSRAARWSSARAGNPVVSGTASIVGHRTVHPGDVAGQCRESLANIAAVVAEANRVARSGDFSPGELVHRVYVREAADFPAVRAAFAELAGEAPGTVFVQADICRADLLVEIEAMAVHPLAPTGR